MQSYMINDKKMTNSVRKHQMKLLLLQNLKLRITECGDETPTAMHDTAYLRKVPGRLVPLELKSRDVFPVDVSRPPK